MSIKLTLFIIICNVKKIQFHSKVLVQKQTAGTCVSNNLNRWFMQQKTWRVIENCVYR